ASDGHSLLGHVANGHRSFGHRSFRHRKWHTAQMDTVQMDTVNLHIVQLDTEKCTPFTWTPLVCTCIIRFCLKCEQSCIKLWKLLRLFRRRTCVVTLFRGSSVTSVLSSVSELIGEALAKSLVSATVRRPELMRLRCPEVVIVPLRLLPLDIATASSTLDGGRQHYL
ncbi:hypothetical protein X777_02648, partial [Ooceraea biroi]